MGVQVDETGRDEQAGRIDLAGAGLVDLSHRGYHAPGHRDVAHERLAAEPVDEGSVADDEFICHIPNVR